MAQHYMTHSVLDASEETSSHKVYVGAITAISIAGFLSDMGDYTTALTNFIKGTVKGSSWVGDSTDISNSAPADQTAQNELKMQMSYEGTTSKKRYRVEIGTPDLTALIPGTDKFDLTNTDLAALITAFEAIARTPDSDTETVNVLDARLVGRNI